MLVIDRAQLISTQKPRKHTPHTDSTPLCFKTPTQLLHIKPCSHAPKILATNLNAVFEIVSSLSLFFALFQHALLVLWQGLLSHATRTAVTATSAESCPRVDDRPKISYMQNSTSLIFEWDLVTMLLNGQIKDGKNYWWHHHECSKLLICSILAKDQDIIT